MQLCFSNFAWKSSWNLITFLDLWAIWLANIKINFAITNLNDSGNYFFTKSIRDDSALTIVSPSIHYVGKVTTPSGVEMYIIWVQNVISIFSWTMTRMSTSRVQWAKNGKFNYWIMAGYKRYFSKNLFLGNLLISCINF